MKNEIADLEDKQLHKMQFILKKTMNNLCTMPELACNGWKV
jgi:hypothetical protein